MSEVTIGTQIWSDEDLAINDGGEGIIIRKFPIRNGFGLGTVYYYNEVALNRISNTLNGWHVPTRDEFITLLSYAGNDNYGDGCRAIYDPNTRLYLGNINNDIPTYQFKAKLAGDVKSTTYLSSTYLRYSGDQNAMIITPWCLLGMEARYWCSDKMTTKPYHNYYYCIRPDDDYKSRSSSGHTWYYNRYDDYMPIRLIKDS